MGPRPSTGWTSSPTSSGGGVEDVPLYIKDAEGYLRENPRPDDALTALPVLRPTAFYYCDFVNEGALTHQGMFSLDRLGQRMDASAVFDGRSSAYPRELFNIMIVGGRLTGLDLMSYPPRLKQFWKST